MSGLIITFFLVAAVPLVLAQPVLGPVVYYWLALMRPDAQMYGVLSVRWTLVLASVSLISALMRAKQWIRPRGMLPPLLIVFVLWYALSTLANPGADLDLLSEFVKVVAMCIVSASILITRTRLHALIWVIVISIGIAAVRTAAMLLVNPGSPYILGPDVLGASNEYARLLLYTFPLVLFLAQYSAHRFIRFGMLGLALCLVMSVVGTNSRGGFVALAAIFGVMWLRGKRKVSIALLVAGLLGSVWYFLPEGRIDSFTSRMSTIENAGEDKSFMSRTQFWILTLDYVQKNPMLGGGAGFSERVIGRASHSSYVEVLGETGYIGMTIWSLIALGVFSTSVRIRRRTKDVPELRWAYDLAYYIQLSLVGYFVGGIVKNHGFFEYYYMLIGMLMGTETAVRVHLSSLAANAAKPAAGKFPQQLAAQRR